MDIQSYTKEGTMVIFYSNKINFIKTAFKWNNIYVIIIDGCCALYDGCRIKNYPKVSFEHELHKRIKWLCAWSNKFYVYLPSFESRMELSPHDHYWMIRAQRILWDNFLSYNHHTKHNIHQWLWHKYYFENLL
jgi:hypothetical protein